MASFSVFAQTSALRDFKTLLVDGQVSSGKLEDIPAHNILKIEKLIQAQAVGSSLNYTTLVITTKPYAIKQYQQKLSKFCKEYQAYLDGSKGDDTELMYVVNGLLTEQRDSLTKKLYETPLMKIKTVAYLGKNQSGDKYLPIRKSIVVITTKK
jgi:hypothetical protein